jgi:hypothetical protein
MAPQTKIKRFSPPAGLYFAVPHASVLDEAPTDFRNTVLQVRKNLMAA